MKKNKSKFSTLAIIIMALAIPVTTYILKTDNLDFRFSAMDSEIPINMRVSDISDTFAIVSWQTEKEVVGGIKLIDGNNTSFIELESNTDHTVVVNNLNSGSIHNFSIISDGTEYMNDTSYYSFQTILSNLPQEPNYFVYGQVFGLDGITFQQNGLIYFELERDGKISQPIVAKINEAGGYQFNLNDLKDKDYNTHFDYFGDTDIILTVQLIGHDPIVRKYLVNLDYAKQLPNMYLGDIDIEFMPGIDGI